MTYLQPSNRKTLHKRRRTRIAITCIALLFALFVFFPQALVHTLTIVVSPFWSLEEFGKGAIGNSFSILRSKISLVNENNELRKVNAQFETLQTAFAELEKVHARSQNAVLSDEAFVSASVLRKPPYSAYDTLLIDKGTDQGVSVGNKVYGVGSVFIGEVVEVFPASSKVVLASSPDKKTIVALQDKGVQFEAVGKGGGNFELDVPAQFEVKNGDVVRLPGSHVHVFGVVERVVLDSSQSINRISFKIPVNIFELTNVVVQILQ